MVKIPARIFTAAVPFTKRYTCNRMNATIKMSSTSKTPMVINNNIFDEF